MARRGMFEVPRALSIAAISLVAYAFLYSGADAQVNAETKIHCVVRRSKAFSGPIDIVIDFQRNTINGAPADGRFRKEKSGDLNAYGIFSSKFIMNIESWADESGESGVRTINYITIDRLHSAMSATTVSLPSGRSVTGKGDCEVAAERAPTP